MRTICQKKQYHWDREKLKDMTVRVVPDEEFDALFQQTLQKYAAERGDRLAD
ncbi:hypothetical protein [Photobacterium lipolyticum]|uniref:hypothetical protein n=1 Tax=Photobacterium lipolyticum TaxID=266810 RepID=UPI001473752C|nr:hypothetical protein [Photobacterium lipolyticum]